MIIEEIYNKRLSKQIKVGDIYVGLGLQEKKIASGRVSSVNEIGGITVSFPVVWPSYPEPIGPYFFKGGMGEIDCDLFNLEEAMFIRFRGWGIEKILVGQKMIERVDNLWQI